MKKEKGGYNLRDSFPGSSEVKNLPASVGNTRDAGSIPRLERSLAGGNGNLLQYSCGKIQWTEEFGGLSIWCHKELNITENTHTHKLKEEIKLDITFSDLNKVFMELI